MNEREKLEKSRGKNYFDHFSFSCLKELYNIIKNHVSKV